MLRNVLLKAVQNLRRSQHREDKDVEQQLQEELQLPKARKERNQEDIDDDNAMENNRKIEITTTTPKKTSTEPTSNDEDSPEKTARGKSIKSGEKEIKIIRSKINESLNN